METKNPAQIKFSFLNTTILLQDFKSTLDEAQLRRLFQLCNWTLKFRKYVASIFKRNSSTWEIKRQVAKHEGRPYLSKELLELPTWTPCYRHVTGDSQFRQFYPTFVLWHYPLCQFVDLIFRCDCTCTSSHISINLENSVVISERFLILPELIKLFMFQWEQQLLTTEGNLWIFYSQ